MNQVAVRVEGLGKRYRLGTDHSFDTLRDLVSSGFRSALAGRARRAREEPFWALRDVSFEVREGEVLGIIGRNGAGKSTLLKILSRITGPSEGTVEIRGRVGALLEVGTGFHPELTGRENVFLNGAVLGLTRREVKAKFDEIVDFAGIDQFLDTPVKRYSSGMKTRLGFAVAAHLEPEVLIIDEVLAVGDAEFQKRCLGKMSEFAGGGRTVLFVSHNMAAVTQLCTRAMWLEHGKVRQAGNTEEVVTGYLSDAFSSIGRWELCTGASDATNFAKPARLVAAEVICGEQTEAPVVPFAKSFQIAIELDVVKPLEGLAVFLRVIDSRGNALFTSWDLDALGNDLRREVGMQRCVCSIPGQLLRPGQYSVTIGLAIRNRPAIEMRDRALAFTVSTVGYNFNEDRTGLITPALSWTMGSTSVSTSGAC